MSDDRVAPLTRRRFIAAAAGSALAIAVDAQAAPLLGAHDRQRALASKQNSP